MTICNRCARPLTAEPERCLACRGSGEGTLDRSWATGILVFNVAAVGTALLAAGPLGLLEAGAPPITAMVLAIGLSLMLLAAVHR